MRSNHNITPTRRAYTIILALCLFITCIYAECYNGCTGKGICFGDVCKCVDGYTGPDCGTPLPRVSIYDCTSCWQFSVGSPEYISGPSVRLPDSQLVSANLKGTLKTWIGNGDAELFSVGTSSSDYLVEVVVSMNSKEYNISGEFDSCGAWISRAIPDESSDVIRALYHAEADCNYDIGQTYKSMAYAESRDGGKTWVRPNYPNNQVLTFNGPRLTGKPSGLGDGSMVRFTDPADGREYYYLYYAKISGDAFISVARSPVSAGGLPGTWSKYNSGWSARPNGIGGPESPIKNINDATIYVHAPSGEILTVGNDYSGGHGGGGAQMSVSKDGLNFRYLPEPLYISSDWRVYGWGNAPAQEAMVGYTSLLGETGGYLVGNTFWMYYLYLKPGQGMNARYFIRRKVTMTYNPDATNEPANRLALSTYVHRTTGEQYETREWVPPTYYKLKKVMGYLMTRMHTESFGVISCLNNGDYYVARIGQDCTSENDTQLEALGFIYAFRQPNTIAVYQCEAPAGGKRPGPDRFLSPDPQCEDRAPSQTVPFGFLLKGPSLVDDLGKADVVVPRASTWSYASSTTSLVSNFTLAGFNDSTWAVGTAPFASGYPVSAPSRFINRDHYFRRQFRLDPSRTAVKALLTLGSDDRSTAWVNGQMVDDDRTVRFWANQAEVWNRRVWLDVSVLRQGAGGQANVIAVHVPNGDSWAYFDAQLTVYYSNNADLPCSARCALNGNCVNGLCICDKDWTGADCSIPECRLGTDKITFTAIDTGDTWKYSSTAVFNPNSVISWVYMNYKDNSWPSGPSPMGAGYFQHPWTQRTTLPYNPGSSNGRDPYSYMFRKVVDIKVPAGYTISSATMGIASDDYHLAYVNGFLVDGDLDPYISHQAAFWNSVVSVNPEMLHNGSNIIAVRVPNWFTSAWMYFDLQLNITLQSYTCEPVCEPIRTCATAKHVCGTLFDGCKYVDCGTCPSSFECNSDLGVCECVPSVSCLGQGISCGTIFDGCKNISCGTCSGPKQICNPKGLCECLPSTTCAVRGVKCGTIFDGCNNVDCGSCFLNQFCNTTAGACQCAPTSTCASQGVVCGQIFDGCNYVNCGSCAQGMACTDKGSCVCVPKTSCAAEQQFCGTIFNGCDYVDCGSCSSHQACVAGHCECVPTTSCKQQGLECGLLDNGCATVDCGTCAAGKVCNSGKCECSPSTSCALQGRTCGTVFNGCQTEQCGSCASGQACNEATGQCQCVPSTSCAAAGRFCGTLFDGCRTVSCGACGSGQACDEAAGKCVCAPSTSCAAQGKSCGSVFNGCERVSCGTCSNGLACNDATGKCECSPTTSCAHEGRQCGTIFNGCETVSCGACSNGLSCNPSGQCQCIPSTSCSVQNKACGTLFDGCEVVNCGSCASGQQCTDGQCQCAPSTTCERQGRTCGTIFDGCKNVNCGSCASGQACSSSTGTCECTPSKTCASESRACGPMFDGCKAIHCGTCAEGTSCSDLGRCLCTPSTSCLASGRTCGTLFNGCENVDCGSCLAGSACDATSGKCYIPGLPTTGTTTGGGGGTVRCGVQVTQVISNSWYQEGAAAVSVTVTIKNTSPSPIPQLRFRLDTAPTSIWTAIKDASAPSNVFTPPAWVVPLAPSSSFEFGYIIATRPSTITVLDPVGCSRFPAPSMPDDDDQPSTPIPSTTAGGTTGSGDGGNGGGGGSGPVVVCTLTSVQTVSSSWQQDGRDMTSVSVITTNTSPTRSIPALQLTLSAPVIDLWTLTKNADGSYGLPAWTPRLSPGATVQWGYIVAAKQAVAITITSPKGC
eukprot:TRINITY_DN2036_c0_g2_i3.p1 TRINITY_DN2036_c0_g2~~TRINITY_DN2036_c0_g2_i3.p1  ORF type:complete len:1787 (-),score=354.62 TRINITY_DN2036_c0_g2_i3:39-5399(-)